MDKRTFIASSDIFSDFSVDISLYDISTKNDIVNIFKQSLMDVLSAHNLTILVEKLKKARLHIHTHTVDDILSSSKDSVFYVCDHCEENTDEE